MFFQFVKWGERKKISQNSKISEDVVIVKMEIVTFTMPLGKTSRQNGSCVVLENNFSRNLARIGGKNRIAASTGWNLSFQTFLYLVFKLFVLSDSIPKFQRKSEQHCTKTQTRQIKKISNEYKHENFILDSRRPSFQAFTEKSNAHGSCEIMNGPFGHGITISFSKIELQFHKSVLDQSEINEFFQFNINQNRKKELRQRIKQWIMKYQIEVWNLLRNDISVNIHFTLFYSQRKMPDGLKSSCQHFNDFDWMFWNWRFVHFCTKKFEIDHTKPEKKQENNSQFRYSIMTIIFHSHWKKITNCFLTQNFLQTLLST